MMTTNQAPKGTVLLPCPFCGSTPLMPEGTDGVWRLHFAVKCGKPNCYGNPSHIRTFATADEAIEIWNSRAQPASAPLQDEDAKPKRTKENTISDLTVAVAESIAKEAHRYRAKKAIDRKGMEQSPAFIGASKKDKKMMLDAWDMSYDYTIDSAIQAQGAKQI